MESYTGGKGGAGVYQKIINLMPPHDVYIEPFLGHGAIMRHKRPARQSVGVDLDTGVTERWESRIVETDNRIQLVHGDGISFLKQYTFEGGELVYCDPPYVPETRRSARKLYKHELDERGHTRLLKILSTLPCLVLISGYHSALYAEALESWNSISFQAMTRAGETATEWLWYNYPTPVELHDYRYLGDSFRERERIKRKKERWVLRLKRMPVLERQALLGAIAQAWPTSSKMTMPAGEGSADHRHK